jgi:hypothetical protein
MLTPGTAANPSWADEPNGQTGFGTRIVREFKRPVALAYLVLAVLGWLAAALAFWHQSVGQEQTAQVEHSGDQQKSLTEVKAAQQHLATTQSALSATIRLRDEAAQSLQEVRDKSAGARKDLAAARDELDDTEQKITARNAELTIISKRLDTARLRKSQENRKANASSPTVATATPEMATTVTTIPKESAAPTPPTKASGSASPGTAAAAAPAVAPAAVATAAIAPAPVRPAVSQPKSIERHSSPIAQTSPPDAAPPIPDAKPSLAPSPDLAPTPSSKERNLTDGGRSIAVIGPGALSQPSDFELHSGRISRTP